MPVNALIVLLLVSAVSGDVLVLSGAKTGQAIEASSIRFNKASLDFAPIVNVTLSTLGDATRGDAIYIPQEDVSGSRLREAVNAGAVAIVLSYKGQFVTNGCGMYVLYEPNMRDITVPIVEVEAASLDDVVKNERFVKVDITWGSNTCHKFYTSTGFAVFQGILALACVSAIGLCLFRLYQYIAAFGFFQPLSLGIVAVSIELLSNSLKFVFVVNFFGSRQLYHRHASDFFITVSLPFTTITSILITMFWHEALVAKGVQVHVFLKTKRFRIGFAIAAFLLVALEFGAAIARAMTPVTPAIVLYLPQILNFAGNLTTLIYSMIILTKMYNKLRTGHDTFSKSSYLRQIVFRMTTNASLLTLLLLSIVVIAIPPKPSTAVYKTTITLGLFYLIQISLSILQVYSFAPVARKVSSAATRSNTSANSSKNNIEPASSVSLQVVQTPEMSVSPSTEPTESDA